MNKNKNYIEISIRLIVKKAENKAVIFKNAINIIDKYICEYSEEYHNKNSLKDYSVSRIEPAVCENFKRGDIVSIKVRTDKTDIALPFENNYIENDFLKVILIDATKILSRKTISEINTLTPAIFTGNEEDFGEASVNKYVFSDRNDLSRLKSAILRNAWAKSGLQDEYDFIEEIKVRNDYPIKVQIPRETNKFTYLADRLEIKIKNDEISQNIAFNLIVKGLGRHCTCGYGFMNYKLDGGKK